MSQHINVGLIKPLNIPGQFEEQLRYGEGLRLKQDELGLAKEKLAESKSQFEQQQQMKELQAEAGIIEANIKNSKYNTPREQVGWNNRYFKLFDLPEINPNDNEAVKISEEIQRINNRTAALLKDKDKTGISEDAVYGQHEQSIRELYSSFSGSESSRDMITAEEERIGALQQNLDKQGDQTQIAQQIANSLPDSFLQGRPPATFVEPIVAMQSQGLDPAQILTALGVEKPGAGAGVKQKITQTAEEISLELYNKSFTELSPDERADVLQTKQDRAVEVSTGKVKGRIEAGLDAPLSSTDLTKFVNPDTLAKFPAGTTMREVRKSGGFAATPTQLQKIADLDNAGFIVTQLDELSKQIITATDAASALIQGGTLKAGAFAKTNTAAAAYEDQLAQFTGVISRALGGERGVLTDTDIRRVVNGMPKFRDTKAIRDFKMGVIQLLFETATDAQKRAITGRAKDPKIRKELNVLLDAIGLGGKRIDTGGKQEIQKQVDTSSMDINTMTREELAAEKQRLMSKPAQ